MDQRDGLEVVRLAAAEIDDQAITEISALLHAADAKAPSVGLLLRLAAAGPIVVVRRPCGLSPEIVGVAGRLSCSQMVVAADPQFVDEPTRALLSTRAEVEGEGPSLFWRRDRPPLGLALRA